MNKYTDLTLSSMKKANLIKYVRSLEEIIAKYDVALNKEYKAINEAIEYIEYYFAKGRTKNHKQFDLSLYEILTGKNLFNLTMKEIEQYFKGVDKP